MTDAETFETFILLNDVRSARSPSGAFEESHLQIA